MKARESPWSIVEMYESSLLMMKTHETSHFILKMCAWVMTPVGDPEQGGLLTGTPVKRVLMFFENICSTPYDLTSALNECLKWHQIFDHTFYPGMAQQSWSRIVRT